jgi:TonB family protein
VKYAVFVVGLLGVPALAATAHAQTPEAAPLQAESSAKAVGTETYPAGSIRNREQGETVLLMCIETDGRPTNVKVAKSSGHKRLDQQSVESMKRQRLNPATDADGKAVRVCDYKVTIDWKLG